MKLNKSKTVAFVVNNDCVKQDDSWGIKWTSEPFETLGIWFANELDKLISLNVSAKVEIINSTINAWIPRKLTLKGKITVIKSLILPHIQQLASVLPFSNSYISKLVEQQETPCVKSFTASPFKIRWP